MSRRKHVAQPQLSGAELGERERRLRTIGETSYTRHLVELGGSDLEEWERVEREERLDVIAEREADELRAQLAALEGEHEREPAQS